MKLTGEFCESLYSTMVKIRRFDEKVAELFQQGIVKGTAHSYVGQEAVAAGACANLREDDFIVSNHRGHGHTIAKGARMDRMMAELMGREDGYCRGLGGSMHIAALDLNILGCNGIVAAGVPIGAGRLARREDPGHRPGGAHVLRRRRRQPGRRPRDHEPRLGLEAPLHLPLREQQVRALHGHEAHDRRRDRQARRRLRHAARARGRQRRARRVRGRQGGRGPGAAGRGPDLRRGGDLPVGRPQHAREPPRLPHQGGRARVDRARPHRALRSPGRGQEGPDADAAQGARAGGRADARRGGALRNGQPGADRGDDGGVGLRPARRVGRSRRRGAPGSSRSTRPSTRRSTRRWPGTRACSSWARTSG